jgi:hypothetical protein
MSEEPIVKPIASPKRDLKQLGKNSKAVVGELREFLANLKGKSPKEMMGAVAESNLVQSLLISTLAMAILVFSLSAIPYYLKQGEEAAQAAEKAKGSSENKTEDEAGTAGSGKASSSEETTTPEAPKTAEQKTAEILGVGEVADPNANPLDSTGTDLLDGLDDL